MNGLIHLLAEISAIYSIVVSKAYHVPVQSFVFGTWSEDGRGCPR